MKELELARLAGHGFQEKLHSAEQALKGAEGIVLRIPPGTYTVSTPLRAA